ncbi:MAG: DNA recombination protein RmuC [Candidatus Pacebacteria bacterium]|jgi:DNA recombination protein RmuC|nr:DNA recombination protein RmuC [Candidatus Paceibacterota bacterium]MDD4994671.1 DNA recombination protein RmuC [Candidatus Paceibacterota bacterium]MDD5535340.1 DNA recombination protein RmuC [Candidatus Paceibacterota bacterium]
MMDFSYTYLLLGLLAGLIVAVGFYFFIIKKEKPKKEDDQSFLLLQNQMQEITRTLDKKLGEIPGVIQSQFGESAKIIREVTEKLTKLDETNKQVINFADQLRNLQDILKNPKQRGVLGEYYLETVLKNVLPPDSFQTQYEFKDGTKVDAVIFIKDKIIPVDSKFSLENYNRLLETHDEAEKKRLEDGFKSDLKSRIDETAKYIKPDEGTMEFAFMFIPSEAIYYDLLINKIGTVKANTRDLIEYAMGQKKVIIVSPTSFLAYLQTVLQGLRALEIEESAKEIKKRVEDLARHLISYENYMQKVGNHLGTTVNMYNSAYKEFNKIDKDVYRISGKKIDADPLEIDRPKVEIDEVDRE